MTIFETLIFPRRKIGLIYFQFLFISTFLILSLLRIIRELPFYQPMANISLRLSVETRGNAFSRCQGRLSSPPPPPPPATTTMSSGAEKRNLQRRLVDVWQR